MKPQGADSILLHAGPLARKNRFPEAVADVPSAMRLFSPCAFLYESLT
jgi:hypothetical protein